jgi:hypothetical protein
VTWADAQGSVCPQCGYDQAGPNARSPQALTAARSAFRDKTTAYAPGSRVSTWDKLRPWGALLLGFVLFVFWLRACSSGGFR